MAAPSPTAVDKLKAVTTVKEPADVNFIPTFKLWTYNFHGKHVYDWDFESQCTDFRPRLGITQASTVEVDLEDSDFQLLNDPLFAHWAWDIEDVSFSSQKKFSTTRITNRTTTAYLGDQANLEWVLGQKPIDLVLHTLLFRLCGIKTMRTTVTLTLEDRVASWLRDHKGSKSWDRSQHTRAQFVAQLCREAGVDYWIPEIDVTQPIAAPNPGSTTNPVAAIVSPNGKGIAHNSNLTLLSLPMTATQKQVANALLGECHRLGAPLVAWEAILYAATGETRMGAVNYITPNSAGAVGVLQGTDPHWKSNPTDIVGQADSFLQGGLGFQGGGAIALAKSGIVDPAQIAVTVEVPSIWPSNAYEAEWGATMDATLRTEIQQIIASYGGPSATGAGTAKQTGTSIGATGSYAFTRGANETSWDCIQRLASEVAWYAFVRQNRLWFVSGDYLFAQDPQLEAEIGQSGVDFIDLDMDMGERDQVAACEVYCRTSMWTALPGMVVEVKNRGPATGKWLVASVDAHPLDATQLCIVTLQKPVPPRAEPSQSNTGSSTSAPSLTGGPSSGGLTNPAPGASWSRLDMGFDGNYSSQGVVAPYNGTVYTPGYPGWPGQGTYFWILNDDQSGPNYTRAMYFAEGATPIVSNGTKVTAGQKIGVPVASGGNGTPGNFEIGPANTTNGDCLAKQIGLRSAAASQMVLAFSAWLVAAGASTPTDTSAAGGP